MEKTKSTARWRLLMSLSAPTRYLVFPLNRPLPTGFGTDRAITLGEYATKREAHARRAFFEGRW